MSSRPSCFELRNIVKRYGNAVVANVNSLKIRPGEVFCLVGPTGAGKSTLLRLLAAVESPTSGEVLFENELLRAEATPSAIRRRIAMVFQHPVLLSGTVRSNVEYGLRIRGRDGSSREKSERMLERLGLTNSAARNSGVLSGGQRQLVALARALVLEPDVLLLDEPTANLDPAHVALVEQVIREDHDRRKGVIVWATHNLFQARRVADRVGLMLNSQLVEVAPTEAFFSSPSDPRTKDFVEGKMIC